jgi:hypothetical protein
MIMLTSFGNFSKRCKDRANMLKTPSKATKSHYETHDCASRSKRILERGWLAALKGLKESLAGVFQHICPGNHTTSGFTQNDVVVKEVSHG